MADKNCYNGTKIEYKFIKITKKQILFKLYLRILIIAESLPTALPRIGGPPNGTTVPPPIGALPGANRPSTVNHQSGARTATANHIPPFAILPHAPPPSSHHWSIRQKRKKIEK